MSFVAWTPASYAIIQCVWKAAIQHAIPCFRSLSFVWQLTRYGSVLFLDCCALWCLNVCSVQAHSVHGMRASRTWECQLVCKTMAAYVWHMWCEFCVGVIYRYNTVLLLKLVLLYLPGQSESSWCVPDTVRDSTHIRLFCIWVGLVRGIEPRTNLMNASDNANVTCHWRVTCVGRVPEPDKQCGLTYVNPAPDLIFGLSYQIVSVVAPRRTK